MSGKPSKFLVIGAGVVLIPLLVFAIPYVVFNVFEFGGVVVPNPPRVELVRLDQGWNQEVARQYHKTSQGTKILPKTWFLALEQPNLNPLLPAGKLAARDYLERFGFLYDDTRPMGEGELPIGLAIEPDFDAPYANPPVQRGTAVVGLTCAACHTGRIDVRDAETGKIKGILIEGGSAMINLSKFQEATGKALAYTLMFPSRFHRFAINVLKKDLPADDPERKALWKDLNKYVETGIATRDYAKEHKLNTVDAGFARTDALGLIGNRLFGPLNEENNTVTDAPVNFPHLWDTPWFDWVQYNASIRMPMARNIGEALGVGAVVNLKAKPYKSTVNVKGLSWMEDTLGGQNPFEGLQPPKWNEDLLGPIDRPKAREGAALYRTHCQWCHLPPRDELKTHVNDPEYDKYWDKDKSGKRFLKLGPHNAYKLGIDLDEIGTDPNQALNFYRRVAVVRMRDPQGPGETISAETGLFRVTSFIRKDKYQELGLFDPQKSALRKQYDRYRTVSDALVVGDEAAILRGDGMKAVVLANLAYKARPLDGIWATPPYLHNGSVPNLYQMLLPAACRSPKFYLGSKRFESKPVGYETREFRGAFLMDTSLPGNRNSGHEFRNLTLEELENAFGMTWDGRMDREARWAKVLETTPDALAHLSDADRWEKTRRASLKARKQPGFKAIKGVLGVEFDQKQRWQLIEYLKTL